MITTASYRLPVIDVCKQLRNFPGYQKSVPGEALIREVMEGGSTDTGIGSERRNDPSDKEGY